MFQSENIAFVDSAMPVLFKEYLVLAAVYQIFHRYVKHARNILNDYPDISPRLLVKDVFKVERIEFLRLLEFSRNVLLANFNLDGRYGQSLVDNTLEHVRVEYETEDFLPINRLIMIACVEGHPENISEAFFKEKVKDQSLYLKAMVHYVKVVIVIKKLNEGLLAINNNGYNHVLLPDDVLLNPGMKMIQCVFDMTQLLAFEGHKQKMRNAKAQHDRENEEYYIGDE